MSSPPTHLLQFPKWPPWNRCIGVMQCCTVDLLSSLLGVQFQFEDRHIQTKSAGFAPVWHFKILQIAVRNVCFTTKTVMTKSLQIQAVLSHESAWNLPKHFEVHAMFNWYGATKNPLATVTDPKLPLVDLQHPARILAWDSKLPSSTSHNKSMQPILWISWSRIEGQNPSSHSSWTDSVHSYPLWVSQPVFQ